jgi:hypothetical protein
MARLPSKPGISKPTSELQALKNVDFTDEPQKGIPSNLKAICFGSRTPWVVELHNFIFCPEVG